MTQLPGPKAPRLIQLFQWVTEPLTFMEKCARQYGDSFEINLNYPMVFISHPKAIEEIFKTNPKQFECGSGNKFLQPLLGDYSLLLLDGTPHQRQRQLLMPPFHGERMQTYGELICNITEQVASKWQVDRVFSMRKSTQEISLKVILQAVFGLYEGERYSRLERLLGSLMESLSSPAKASMLFFEFLQIGLGTWSPWGKFTKEREEIYELLCAEISERRQNLDPERSDILTMLLLARDEAGEGMSDIELQDELMTLLLAGHETTATALAWAFYWSHHQSEIYDKLLQELATIGDDTNPMEIMKLPYLNAVCSESLRIYPVVLITSPRETKSPITIMGQEYPAGTGLVPCIYLTHHREDLYPEPKKFKPERFLERQYSAYEFLPFGGSNRRCIGAAFAMFEMKLVLATILRRYNLALAEKQPVKTERRSITLSPAGGIKMVMTGKRMQGEEILPSAEKQKQKRDYIAEKQKYKIEFTRLKEKYKVTEFEDSSPDSNLYKILQKIEVVERLTKADIDWLKSYNLTKIIKVAEDKYLETDWIRLQDKYVATDRKLKFDPFYNILSKLDRGEQLDKLMFTQLTTENLLTPSSNITITYYQIEADFFEEEFKRTKNKWLIPKISSYWCKAEEPLKALEITSKVNLEKLKDQDLKARILVTRGGAFRDNYNLNEAKNLALQAHKIDYKSHHPCTLLGTTCFALGEYQDGDYWFEEARKRGAYIKDIDREIKRLVQDTSNNNKRKEIIEYLLKKDDRKYAWAREYLKN